MGTNDVTGGLKQFYMSSELRTNSPEPVKRRIFQVGPYQVTVLLTADDKIISVEQVGVAKTFLSLEQRLESSDSHDVEQYFKDEAAPRSR